MDIKHHLSDELLSGYAAGTLAEGWSIAVATHLALCPACRSRLKQFEQIGGQLLDAGEPQKLEVSTWDSFKDRLQKTPQSREPSAPRFEIKQPAVIPEPLRSYVGGDLPELNGNRLAGVPIRCQLKLETAKRRFDFCEFPQESQCQNMGMAVAN